MKQMSSKPQVFPSSPVILSIRFFLCIFVFSFSAQYNPTLVSDHLMLDEHFSFKQIMHLKYFSDLLIGVFLFAKKKGSKYLICMLLNAIESIHCVVVLYVQHYMVNLNFEMPNSTIEMQLIAFLHIALN